MRLKHDLEWNTNSVENLNKTLLHKITCVFMYFVHAVGDLVYNHFLLLALPSSH